MAILKSLPHKWIVTILIVLIIALSVTLLIKENKYVTIMLVVTSALLGLTYSIKEVNPRDKKWNEYINIIAPLQEELRQELANSKSEQLGGFFGMMNKNMQKFQGDMKLFDVGIHRRKQIAETVDRYLTNIRNLDTSYDPFTKTICTYINRKFDKVADSDASYDIDRMTTSGMEFSKLASRTVNEYNNEKPIIVSDTKIYRAWTYIDKDSLISNRTHTFISPILDSRPSMDRKIINTHWYIHNNMNNPMYIESKLDGSNQVMPSIDMEWFTAMDDYISNLPNKKLFTLLGYTKYGDKAVNWFLRNNEEKISELLKTVPDLWNMSAYFPYYFQMYDMLLHTQITEKYCVPTFPPTFSLDDSPSIRYLGIRTMPDTPAKFVEMYIKNMKSKLTDPENPYHTPMLPDEEQKHSIWYRAFAMLSILKLFSGTFWREVIEKTAKDIKEIIYQAPPLKTELVVYRGVVDKPAPSDAARSNLYKTDSFMSTTMDVQVAREFSDGHYIQRIVMLPGTKGLILEGISDFPGEMEMLLAPGSVFVESSESSVPYYKYELSDHTGVTNVCDIDKVNIKMNDLIMLI